jgi:CPA2 family monovalent cation:H+ antiporter-2
MPHDVTLIATIAVAFVLAFLLGFVANRLRLPPLVGYLVAGVIMGSHAPGMVATDTALAGQLAEIGVILLMFGVGLHFSLADLLAVRRIAIPGAVGQIVIATAIGAAMAMLWGWTLGAGLILGLSLSVASTVVLLKALEERSAVATPNGRVAIGWLIVEDLAMVLVLVLLPALATMLGGKADAAHGGDTSVVVALGTTLLKVAAFGAVALLIGPRVMPWLLRHAARTGSRELFTLAVLALSVGIAYGAASLFGVSFALGAFFAGMVLNESDLSHKAATNSLPLQDAFAVLFFVSVGMLFDASIIVREPLLLLSVLGLVLIGKSIVALAIVWALGYPISTGLTVSAALAQIGEFSFILAGLGISYGLLPPEGLSLILAAALISISVNPLAFRLASALLASIRGRPVLYATLEENRGAQYARLQQELEAARLRAEDVASKHRTLSPGELVDRFPLFAALTPEQREVLMLHFVPFTANPGERIIRKGDRSDAIYFISSGQVEVSVARRRIHLGPGNFIGEMGLITGQPRSADVTALDYSTFLKLTERDFREMVRRYPDMRAPIERLAAQRGEENLSPADATVIVEQSKAD